MLMLGEDISFKMAVGGWNLDTIKSPTTLVLSSTKYNANFYWK